MRLLGFLSIFLFAAGCASGPASVPARSVTASTTAPPGPMIAAGGALKVYFGNLHSHTGYSDGSGTPEEAYRHARDVAKVDFLAITEHNHSVPGSDLGPISQKPHLYNGPQQEGQPLSLIAAAERFDDDSAFVAIYGQEFSTIKNGNHANVFLLADVIDENQVPNGDYGELLDTWLVSHKDNFGKPALMLLNHPAQSDSSNTTEYGRDDYNSEADWKTALQRHAALINIVNGPSHNANGNPGRPSESEYRRYLNLGFRLGPTADQDNHLRNWGNAAETRTGVLAPRLSREAIIDALRERRVYATEDSNLSLELRVEGELLGGFVRLADAPSLGAPIGIELKIRDADEPGADYAIDIYSDVPGGADAKIATRATAAGNGDWTIEGPPYTGAGQYVFLRIRQADGDRVWTAPVWFGAP